MSEHTPEPWGYRSNSVYFELFLPEHEDSGMSFAGIFENEFLGVTPEVQQANARRIVACVNACRWVATEALEKTLAEGHTILTSIQPTYRALTMALTDAVAANDRAHVAKVELADALRERDEARALVKELAEGLDACADALRDVNISERGDPDDGHQNVELARLLCDKARAYLAALD